MHIDVAIDIVARGILGDLLLQGTPDHSDYPDIGENDWDAVHQRFGEMIGELRDEEYQLAYDLLAARAERGRR